MDIQVLYEDSDIVVVDKPSGVIVNNAQTVTSSTMQDWMSERYRDIWSNVVVDGYKLSEVAADAQSKYRGTSQVITDEDRRYFAERVGMVHRLDKETSGVMIFAKSTESFVDLLAQFREHTMQKEYLAWTHGIWKAKSGEINLPIGRRSDDRKKMGVVDGGRESMTSYSVIEERENIIFPKDLRVDSRGYQGFSLVRFSPKTGRTHQIRVHARAVGHPLVGDVQYGGRKRSREDRKFCPRVALQAQKLSINHPITKERMTFESKMLFDILPKGETI